MLAPVKVVELRLGDRVVDVDGREEEGALLLHGVQPVHSRGGLLRDSLAASSNLVPLIGLTGLEEALDDREDDLELLVVRRGGVGEGSVLKEGILGLLTLVDKQSHITTVIDDDIGSVTLAIVLGPGYGAQGALPVLLEGLSLPRENSGALVTGDSGSGVVLYSEGKRRATKAEGSSHARQIDSYLSAEDVARAPSDVSTDLLQSLNEDGRLDGHVQGSGDTRAGKGLPVLVLLDAVHESRHCHSLSSIVGFEATSDLLDISDERRSM